MRDLDKLELNIAFAPPLHFAPDRAKGEWKALLRAVKVVHILPGSNRIEYHGDVSS